MSDEGQFEILERMLRETKQAHLDAMQSDAPDPIRRWNRIDETHERMLDAERALAKARGVEYAIALNIDFSPSPSGSDEVFFQTSDSPAFLAFLAISRRLGPAGYFEDLGCAVFWFPGATQSRFGLPNDEAIRGHPLYGRGLCGSRVCEVVGSNWIREVTLQNRICFPEHDLGKDLRHLIFPFKENTLEILARQVEYHLAKKPIAEVIREAVTRLLHNPTEELDG